MRIATSVVLVLCAASKAAAGRCLTNLSQVSFTYNYPYGVPIPYRRYYKDPSRTVLSDGNLPTRITRDHANCISMGPGNLITLCDLTQSRPQWCTCSY